MLWAHLVKNKVCSLTRSWFKNRRTRSVLWTNLSLPCRRG